ncbi:MAG: FliM/FliN family flagellar motor C-terminal domain-containing protein [Planctomycetota bacterium]
MPSDLETILKLDLPVIVRLAERQMPIDDVLDWVPGCIVDLAADSENELDLLLNNIAIGQGRAVKIGENFGLRLTFVGDLQAKIQALSGGVHDLGGRGDSDEDDVSDAEAQALADQMLSGQF